MQELTPMMRQYFDIKNQYPDCVLFYRLGDFYEMFYDDAILASKELEIALTGKNCGQEERAPMCGVPYHSSEAYIARLIARGHKVAICEQTEDPAKARGLVARDVVRVVTPGTLTETSMLDENSNNFICAVFMEDGRAGLCFSDISTGEMHVTELSGADIGAAAAAECERFSVREALLNDAALSSKALTDVLRDRLACAVEPGDAARFDLPSSTASVTAQFEGQDAVGTLCAMPAACRAVGGLLSYLYETQKSGLPQLRTLALYTPGAFMTLGSAARRNLELFETLHGRERRGSLLWVLDRTETAMGARLLRQWMEKPLRSPAAIRRRQNAVAALTADMVRREELSCALGGVFDLERLAGKVACGTASARDLRALASTAAALPSVRAHITGLDAALLRDLHGEIDELQDVRTLIEQALADEPPLSLREGGLIRDGFHPEVDTLRDAMKNGKSYIAAMEAAERERTGIKNLKIGFNKVFGYYIEITKSFYDLTPPEYIRKQTLANCERFITEDLKNLEGRVLGAQERIIGLEYEIFVQLRERAAQETARIQQTAAAVATLDVLCAFADAAVRYDYVMPDVDADGVLRITGGRHPVVERMLRAGRFVPNDTQLGTPGQQVAIITGPNMAGKSTYMRQTALIVLMAQLGSFVPAQSARIGVVDQIFTRIGASDDLAGGQSTFMVEMREVAEILRDATTKSLLILDEIGRGTSTFDGMSIARAVLEHVSDPRCLGAKTMFATHYHELTELSEVLPGVCNLHTAVTKRGDDITFLRRILPGGADDSYGIEVAKLAGVPARVITRAKEVLAAIEGGSEVKMTARRAKKGTDLQKAPEDGVPQVSIADFGAVDLAQRVRGADLNAMTPMDALNFLFEMQKRARELP